MCSLIFFYLVLHLSFKLMKRLSCIMTNLLEYINAKQPLQGLNKLNKLKNGNIFFSLNCIIYFSILKVIFFCTCDAPKADWCKYFKWLEEVNPGRLTQEEYLICHGFKRYKEQKFTNSPVPKSLHHFICISFILV